METIDLADDKEYPEKSSRHHGEMKHGEGEARAYPRDPMPDHGRRMRSSNDMMAEYFSGLTKEEFGWTLEEKYNQIKPEQRYLPLIMEASRSKQAQAYAEFM
jgi:alkanesulfonate monooxygenase SsuD/methylene tetrahydromethanopterin reductase-like flavin-dependent oxidoreductase (luciferase family)